MSSNFNKKTAILWQKHNHKNQNRWKPCKWWILVFWST